MTTDALPATAPEPAPSAAASAAAAAAPRAPAPASPAAPPAMGLATPLQTQHSPQRSPAPGASWLSVLAALVAAVALIAVVLLWQRLNQTQQELARRTQEANVQASQVRQQAGDAGALAQALQARLAVAEVKLSEVSLQRSQLEELMLALSRSRDDNLVQDIESALRLAMQQAQLTGSAQPLISALQAADLRIARAAQPRLNPVQRAIQRDIDRIKGVALSDVPTLVLRVDELTRQVDDWPVLNDRRALGQERRKNHETPAQRQRQQAPAGASGQERAAAPGGKPLAESGRAGGANGGAIGVGGAHSDGVATEGGAPEPDGAAGTAGLALLWQNLRSFWSSAWAGVTQQGQELLRVSRIDQPDAVLLAPEQAFFLRENLKLRLLNVRLGLLGRQLEAVDADLRSAERALARYFDTSLPAVKAAQAELSQLRSDLPGLALPRPDESLGALVAAAGGR